MPPTINLSDPKNAAIQKKRIQDAEALGKKRKEERLAKEGKTKPKVSTKDSPTIRLENERSSKSKDVSKGRKEEAEDKRIKEGGFASISSQVKKSLDYKTGDPRSLKTTLGLGLTLASASMGSYFLSAAVKTNAGAASTSVITRTATALNGWATGNSMTTQRAFQGVTKNPNVFKIFNLTKRVANNSKNLQLKSSYLMRLAKTATNPVAVLGILGTTLYTSLFWAPNEKGDALTTLAIVQREAVKNGDLEAVKEIDDLIQETLEISASIPVIGFLKSELAKFAAAAKASEVYLKEAEKIAEEQTGDDEETFEESSNRLQKEKREKELKEREEDEKYYEQLEKDREEKREKEREEDEKYYEQIRLDKEIAEKKGRKEEAEYWAKITEEQEAREKKKKEEEAEYWANIRKNNPKSTSTYRRKSLVQF